MRCSRAVWVVLAALLIAAPAALAAEPATLTGKLTGARLPAAGGGVVPVAAVSLRDGRVVAGAYASPAGRFTLKAPKGSYALLAAVVSARGSKPLERVADVVTAKAGKRIALRPTLAKRTGTRRRARRAGARAAFVQVDVPAIWVRHWQTPPGELAVMRKGMPDMLISDLVGPIGRCDAVIVERDRLDEILAELRRQQSPYFDPATRVQTGRLIAHNATVDGTLTVAGDTVTLTSTYHDQRSGRRATVSVSGPQADVFALEQQLAGKLARVICVETPKTYTGMFSGTATTQLNAYTVRWSGSATLELAAGRGAPPEGWPAGEYARYVVRSGSAHVTLDGSRVGGGLCAVHGEVDVVLPAGEGGGTALVQLDAPDEPAFWLMLTAPADAAIPYTETGSGCNQVDPRYPLFGMVLAFTPTLVRGGDGLLSASTSWAPNPFSRSDFSFSLAP